MRKTLVLTLALWAGISNFAYASARLECVVQMQRASCHAMAQPADTANPCPCSIQAPTDHRVVSDVFALQTDSSFSLAPAADAVRVMARSKEFFVAVQASPPLRPPLYELFSVYRI